MDSGAKDPVPDRIKSSFELGGKFQIINPTWVLVHALVRPSSGQPEEEPYAHCFCELGNEIYDPLQNQIFYRESYLEQYQIIEMRKYNCSTALEKMWKSNHWGPW
jgi:hypothetical protein